MRIVTGKCICVRRHLYAPTLGTGVGLVPEGVGAVVGIFGVNIDNRLGKLILPNPVAGSHPLAAVKPALQHIGFLQELYILHLLLPIVISLNIEALLA